MLSNTTVQANQHPAVSKLSAIQFYLIPLDFITMFCWQSIKLDHQIYCFMFPEAEKALVLCEPDVLNQFASRISSPPSKHECTS